jgi:hypothetical protein
MSSVMSDCPLSARDALTDCRYRHLRSAQQKLLTMPTTRRVLLATPSSSYGAWMRRRGSVSGKLSPRCITFLLVTNLFHLVFRVAHDSAKETRIWAGEAKKR